MGGVPRIGWVLAIVGVGDGGVGMHSMTIGKSGMTLHLRRQTVALSWVKVRTSMMAGVGL